MQNHGPYTVPSPTLHTKCMGKGPKLPKLIVLMPPWNTMACSPAPLMPVGSFYLLQPAASHANMEVLRKYRQSNKMETHVFFS